MDRSFVFMRTKGGRPWRAGGVQPARHTRRGYLCLYYSTVCLLKQEGKDTDTPYPCEKSVKPACRKSDPLQGEPISARVRGTEIPSPWYPPGDKI